MTQTAMTVDPDVKVAITLVSVGYEGEGRSPAVKLLEMNAALEHLDLPTAGQWKIVWGPAEHQTDLWFVAEGPNASGTPTLALVIRGTQMHRIVSLEQDLQLGQVPLPFAYPGASPNVAVSKGFATAFGRLLLAKSAGLDALSYLRQRLGANGGAERIHVIGHSLGGGLAPMVGLWVQSQFPKRFVKVFPFGGQSTGNHEFVSLYRGVFCSQPSRYITSLDVTPLMFADLGQLARFWPNGPYPPAWVVDLIALLRSLWSKYESTRDACLLPATMYISNLGDSDPWTTQTHQQHEHRYYMYLCGIPKAAITNTFGPWYPPPGKPMLPSA